MIRPVGRTPALARYALALVVLVLTQTAFAFAAEQVDLLLVLSSDVSRSVDHPKFLLQREGYATAISDPHVMDAIKSGPHQRIAICFVEWSGFGAQKLVIDWTVIDGPGAARKFGDQLLELPRSFADRTSISGGIEFAAAQLERAPFEGARRTIDVSGDGTNNAGRDVKLARDETIAKGIVDQWPRDPERPAGALERRAHQPAWRAREILPGQCHRRARRVRPGGRELQLVRPRHHQEADRRDRLLSHRRPHVIVALRPLPHVATAGASSRAIAMRDQRTSGCFNFETRQTGIIPSC